MIHIVLALAGCAAILLAAEIACRMVFRLY
jgi:hypothetical protein